MPVTHLASAAAANGPPSALDVSPSSGSLLVVGVGFEQQGDLTVSASVGERITCTASGLTFTRQVANPAYTFTADWGAGCAIFTAHVATGGTYIVSIGLSGSPSPWHGSLIALEVTGHDDADPIGLTGGYESHAGEGGSLSVSLGGTTASDSAVVGFVFSKEISSNVPVPSSGWTTLDDQYDAYHSQAITRTGALSSVAWDTVNSNLLRVAVAIEIQAASSGGTDDVTPTGIATDAPSVGAPALGQIHALTATGPSSGAPSVGSPAIGQEHDLTATGIAADAPSVGEPTLAMSHNLAADDVSTDAPSVGEPDIGQIHALGATDVAAAAPSVGSPAIGQIHALGATGPSTGAPSVGAPALVHVVALSPTGIATDAPTVGEPDLEEAGLSLVGVSGGTPAVGAPALGQIHGLTATGIATSAPSVGSPATTTSNALTPTGVAAAAPSVGAPALTVPAASPQLTAVMSVFPRATMSKSMEPRVTGAMEINP